MNSSKLVLEYCTQRHCGDISFSCVRLDSAALSETVQFSLTYSSCTSQLVYVFDRGPTHFFDTEVIYGKVAGNPRIFVYGPCTNDDNLMNMSV